MIRQVVYILFLITGIFCLYVVVLFFRGPSSLPNTTTIDYNEYGPSLTKQLTSLGVTPPPSNSSTPDENGIQTDLKRELHDLSEKIGLFQKKLDPDDIPISPDLSERLVAEYEISPIDVAEIFGFYIFANLSFTAYTIDTARIYVFKDPYYIIQRNIFLLASYFSFNETNTFFGKSFFLNSHLDDGIVRFVFEHDGRAYGVEVLRMEYEDLKRTLIR